MKGHERWEELAAGHALSALEPEDEELFLAHLRGCDLCVRTLEEMRALAGQLAYAAEPAEPAYNLGERITSRLATTGRPAIYPTDQVVVRLPRRRLPLSETWIGVAAAVVMLLGLGLWNVNLRQQLQVARADAAGLRSLADIVSNPATRRALLTSDAGVSGSVHVNGRQAWLVVTGLDRNDPAASVYVLWWMDAGGTAHGIDPGFHILNRGTNDFDPMSLPVPVTDITAFAISRERCCAIPATPSTPLAAGKLET